MSGPLPSAWGKPDALPELLVLLLDHGSLTGTLPPSWGSAGGFRKLNNLWLGHAQLHGGLPDAWAQDTAFPDLQVLLLDMAGLSGTLPVSWAAPGAFPSLLVANFSYNDFQGSLPAFDNAILGVVDVEGCKLDGTLDELWRSSAPLTAIQASQNRFSGSLPEGSGCLPQLGYLGLRDNALEGTVPLSWLRPGATISHVSYLDLGTVWDDSVAQPTWRQELCLEQPVLFYTDVTGRQAALLPTVNEHMIGQRDTAVQASRNLTAFEAWSRAGGSVGDTLLADTFLEGGSQLVSVRQICENSGFEAVLLILWSVLGGSCLIVVGVYAVACRLTTKAGKTYFGLKSWLLPLWALGDVVVKGCSGFGGLAFYWYDCVSGVIVMCQVWHTWPGHALATIFFFHFAAVGAVLTCHAVRRFIDYDNDKLVMHIFCNILAVALSPLMIPVVLLLDTAALVREILVCIKHAAKLPGLKWLQPGYVAAFRVNRCIHAANCLGLSWLDLESYEDMHNLLAAIFQSLPTVILNSIIFALGEQRRSFPGSGGHFMRVLSPVIATCATPKFTLRWWDVQSPLRPGQFCTCL
ncbi:hypothetical protein ABBQ38_006893 [Trebouxia sp. C0009 RCD-2024]